MFDLKSLLTPRMKKMLIAIAIIFGSIFGFFAIKVIIMTRMFANFQPPPATISSSVVEQRNWQPLISSVGSFSAVNGVDISSEVQGMITGIPFQPGQMVKKGDLLVELNDDIEQADLENNVAAMHLAQISYERQSNLLKTNATSKSTVDEAKARYDQSVAQVDRVKAQIQQKNITAPFDGKLGVMSIDLGQFVNAGDKLVTLQALSPLYVNFSLPEQDLPKIAVGQKLRINVDAYPSENFEGEIHAINSKVDENTRNVQVQGIVQNTDLRLFPGMFANIAVVLPVEQNVLVIPQTAISYSLYGDSVFIIEETRKDKDDKPILTVKRQFVTTGERDNNDVVIESGLTVGQSVVTSGQLKLENGTHVLINNSAKLENTSDAP